MVPVGAPKSAGDQYPGERRHRPARCRGASGGTPYHSLETSHPVNYVRHHPVQIHHFRRVRVSPGISRETRRSEQCATCSRLPVW